MEVRDGYHARGHRAGERSEMGTMQGGIAQVRGAICGFGSVLVGVGALVDVEEDEEAWVEEPS